MSTVDLGAARRVVISAAEQVAGLLATIPSGELAVSSSDWKVREVAAHLVTGAEVYLAYAKGQTEAIADVSDIPGGSLARSSAALIAAEPERDLKVLARRLVEGTEELVRITDGRPGDEAVMWNGRPSTLAALLGLAAGEYLIHGLDLARTVRRDWPIGADAALVVAQSAMPALPILVDPIRAAGVCATYELRLRGGPSYGLRFDSGRLEVTEPGGPVDCCISAEPVALLLVFYRRSSQWSAIGRAKLAAWGRRPWLGLKLTSYLVSP